MSLSAFSHSQEARDRFCKEKDKVLLPILSSIEITDPKTFRAILMPACYGIEARYLVAQGVPPGNLFAVEADPITHAEIEQCRAPDRQELRGMLTSGKPCGLVSALDEAWFALGQRPLDLIYLDFFSQPDYGVHYKGCLRKIGTMPMLTENSTLICTFGQHRCQSETAAFNRRLAKEARTRGCISADNETAEVLFGAAFADGLSIKSKRSHTYRSAPTEKGARHIIMYTTTVVRF